ncbi:MAG: adenosylhomocysteinase [Clostridiales Family XIII bacterium]|jgi:adenosylhomocysteinase|nr:adenosylhomocysteinase [Clostridiales Family XIII bacterium]
MNKNFEIKDIALAASGERKIAWVREHMPLLRALEEKYADLPQGRRPLDGVRLSLSIHMEAKTAYLCRVLAWAGAAVSAMGCNVLSTQDDVAAALAKGRTAAQGKRDHGGRAISGISVFAVHGESQKSYAKHVEMCLAQKPNIVIDDGGDLVGMLHTKRRDLAAEVWGGGEETTTGVIRLKALESEGKLMFPMLAVNDARCKHLFDNRYGTGQSVWDSILRNTNLIIASKAVVVAGYGWCGRGIAMRAAALGASVIVTEIDPVKAMEARMDGYAVMKMSGAAPLGDIFITATGCKDVITLEHMALMKDGAILGNAGHFNVEVDVTALAEKAEARYGARANIETFALPGGKRVNIIAEGRLLNIAAADGHPAEIMDISFAVQFYAALYVAKNHASLERRVYDVSDEIDEIVSRARLAAWGVSIDKLTPEQERYLRSWEV